MAQNDRVFTKWDGQPMNPQTPYGWLKDFCKDNDVPLYGVHQFRHQNNIKTHLLIHTFKNNIPLQKTA